ncbi:MAG: GTPase HflX [Coxiella sp. RIFCSPHIGHO2_12_FULL_42_15]|nr:MAG: GTPase HflX [Coxiella sp. RIFCSPHIGHO2_12_FULL_42_15]
MRKTNKYFIDRYAGGDRAVLVHMDLFQKTYADALAEFEELVRSAGAEILTVITGKRSKPESKFFVGSGKVDEIRQAVQALKAEVVIFNHDLSPSQERNIEKVLECRVLDRTGLILDIFAQRARTFEGKLQVELAQLKHMATRLVRGWTHLERQKGGIGLRGPGETQLETDRRLVSARIKSINKRLEKVLEQRHQSRRRRVRADIPTVAIVGYTNAGKSTLFNALTTAHVYTAHQLFATLDPTLRTLYLPPFGKVILADTVGFIRELPHDLVAAFRATLEETRQADLLLHVIDANHTGRNQLVSAVHDVLVEIGADEIPVLEIYNKIDLRADVEPHINYDDQENPTRVWCSALTGAGLDLINEAVLKRLAEAVIECDIVIAPEAHRVRAELYQKAVVQAEKNLEDGNILLTIVLQRADLEKLLAEQGISLPRSAKK